MAYFWCHIFAIAFTLSFEVKSDYDWMSKYFFTGGLMPSTSTFAFSRAFRVGSTVAVVG